MLFEIICMVTFLNILMCKSRNQFQLFIEFNVVISYFSLRLCHCDISNMYIVYVPHLLLNLCYSDSA